MSSIKYINCVKIYIVTNVKKCFFKDDHDEEEEKKQVDRQQQKLAVT